MCQGSSPSFRTGSGSRGPPFLTRLLFGRKLRPSPPLQPFRELFGRPGVQRGFARDPTLAGDADSQGSEAEFGDRMRIRTDREEDALFHGTPAVDPFELQPLGRAVDL